jgi:hypothetical protein
MYNAIYAAEIQRDVSKEHTASIFKVKDESKPETNTKRPKSTNISMYRPAVLAKTGARYALSFCLLLAVNRVPTDPDQRPRVSRDIIIHDGVGH